MGRDAETCLWGFRQSEIQTSLLSYRDSLKCSKSIYDTFQSANNKGAVQTARMRRLVCAFVACKVSEGAKISNRYNQVPHLTQDTNGKVTSSR